MARDGIDILTEMLKEMQQTHKVDDQQLESLKALKDLASQSAGSLGGTNNRVQLAPAQSTATPNPYGIQGQPAGPPPPNPIPLAPLQHGPAPLPLAPLPGSVPPLNPLKALAPEGPPTAQMVPQTPIAPMLAVMNKVSTDVSGILAILQKVSIPQGGNASAPAAGGASTTPPLATLAAPEAAGAGAQGGAAAGLSAALGGIGAAFGAVKGAVDAVVGTFNQLTSQISTFVQALAPATVERFGQAMHDLQATIGTALQPLLDVATELARELGSVLLPVMEELRPILAQLGQAFGSIAKGLLGAFAGILQSLLPLLQLAVDAFSAFTPLQMAFNAVLSGLIQVVLSLDSVFTALSAAFGGNVKSLSDGFTRLGVSLITAVGAVLRFTDSILGTSFLKQYIQGVQNALGGGKRKDNTGLGVASNPRIGGLSDFAKSVNTASLLAGGSGSAKKPEQQQVELLKESLDALKGMANRDPIKDITEAMGKFWDSHQERIKDMLRAALRGGFDATTEKIKQSIAGGALIGGLGRLITGR